MDENTPHSDPQEETPPHSLLSPRNRDIEQPEEDNPSSNIEPSSSQQPEEWHEIVSQHPIPPESTFSAWVLPILLFGLTIFTTLWAGAYVPYAFLPNSPGPIDLLLHNPAVLLNGFPFSVTLLTILVTHELGHYVLTRIHRVPASLPLFIPGPPHVIGTFGAVIRMRSPIMERRALFDIGVSGPITGFIAAVFALIIGLSLSQVVPRFQTFGPQLGEPLFLQFIAWVNFGPIPDTHDIVLHPIAFAAWFGFFVTALNLIPIGQLDGGHVAFALFGRRQRTLALIAIPILLILGLTGWPGWIFWAGLTGLVGLSHPPVLNPHAALGKKRIWIAWSALAIFVLSFSPVPFYF
ncbi:MAG: site-2 protease family protein [Nitrospirales bacterium]